MSYNDVTDWLGPNWQDGLGVYNSYLGMNPGLFELGRQFVQWAQNNDKLPSDGSISNPSVFSLEPSAYLDLTGLVNGSFDVYDFNSLNVGYAVTYLKSSGRIAPINNIPNKSIINLSWNSFTIPSQYLFSLINANDTPTLEFYGSRWAASGDNYNCGALYAAPYPDPSNSTNNYHARAYGPMSSWNVSYLADLRYNPFLIFFTPSSSSFKAYPAMIYRAINGLYYISYNQVDSFTMNNVSYQNYFTIYRNTGSANVVSTGVPDYNFNNRDMIYIDLQQGELSNVLSALQNLLLQVNQNLVQATLALQEASASNLPVDTTPFLQLISSYESVTNDCISGNISVTSALGSMYTLLSSSISNISNPSLENACISAYNAFLNKLSLFQSSGGSSQSIGNYENVQDFQSDLNDLIDSYNSNQSTISQILTSAATLLDTYMSSSEGMQEVIGLQNAYNLFLNDLGFELNLSSNASDVIDGFNDTLDDYLSGDIDRSTALSDLRTGYRNGISGSVTATDVGAITSAYQVALDQIAINEFDISTDLGEISADTISLESDLLAEFDYYTYAELFDFEEWQLFPQQESSLYREYFQRILADTSPFYAFVYYPLILGIAGLVLGSAITFSSKGKNSRGSYYKPGKGDK